MRDGESATSFDDLSDDLPVDICKPGLGHAGLAEPGILLLKNSNFKSLTLTGQSLVVMKLLCL